MSEVDPGEGWRLLVTGERINENTDQAYRDDLKKWIPIITLHGHEWNEFNHYPVRRKLGASVNPSHVDVTMSGPYVAIEVHRAALAEIERLKAELDKRCEIWRIARDIAANERDAAESEVKRLRAELEAVKQPQAEPSKDPDEWVAITDENHVARRGIDHIRAFGGGLEPVLGLAGMLLKDISTELFCRRRDLPPMLEQQPKTETVTFHEVIVVSPETNNRYLCLVEHIDKRQGDIPTGRTETREVVR